MRCRPLPFFLPTELFPHALCHTHQISRSRLCLRPWAKHSSMGAHESKSSLESRCDRK